MKPTIGIRVVILGHKSNGSSEHPAVITRVWSDDDTIDRPQTVNVTAFLDNAAPHSFTSIKLYDTKAQAVDARQTSDFIVAFLPAREGEDAPAPH